MEGNKLTERTSLLSMMQSQSSTTQSIAEEKKKKGKNKNGVDFGDDVSNIHLERLLGTCDTDVDDPYYELDMRSAQIVTEIRKKIKEAPKTLMAKAEEKKGAIERQLEDSDKRLSELLSFGEELVTNIKVANEKRELKRKDFESIRNASLKMDLKKESIASLALFNDITARWQELDAFKEPMALFEQLENQKQNIAALMESKDTIIEECQKEIDRINEKYYSDQEKQKNDVRCMIERIDSQVELIKMAYKSHMELLENTIEEERHNITLGASDKWKDFYEEMAEKERKKIDIAKEKEMFYDAEVERIVAKQEEITRATRIRLEKECEMLEWELRNVKNTVLMNSEKLDYNYQVLQKRNEENVIINNQQKRRVAKLTEGISTLKAKIHASALQAETTLRKFSTDIQKLHSSISELEIKSHQFHMNNRHKFNRVWEINFKEIKTLLTKVFEIDRILYEQQLALPWINPDVDFTDINAPQDDISCSSSNFELMPHEKRKKCRVEGVKAKQIDVGLLRNILRRIADRAGYLIEDKLLKILEPYTEEEKCLVRIDNIFTALRITDIKIVTSMTSCFRPYAWCPNCSTGVSDETMENFYGLRQDERGSTRRSSRRSSSRPSGRGGAMGRRSTNNNKTRSSPERVVHKVAVKPEDEEAAKSCTNHILVIEPAFVLTALNEFTKLQSVKKAVRTSYPDSSMGNPNMVPLDNATIKMFWSKFRTYMPKEKHKLWQTLEHGLNHYLDVLKQRAALDAECTFLRKQNQELKHLLQKFKV